MNKLGFDSKREWKKREENETRIKQETTKIIVIKWEKSL